jgi:hypothetical protein
LLPINQDAQPHKFPSTPNEALAERWTISLNASVAFTPSGAIKNEISVYSGNSSFHLYGNPSLFWTGPILSIVNHGCEVERAFNMHLEKY